MISAIGQLIQIKPGRSYCGVLSGRHMKLSHYDLSQSGGGNVTHT
jgi:hypothetical protein